MRKTAIYEVPLTGRMLAFNPVAGHSENPVRPAVRFLEEFANELQEKEPSNVDLWGYTFYVRGIDPGMGTAKLELTASDELHGKVSSWLWERMSVAARGKGVLDEASIKNMLEAQGEKPLEMRLSGRHE